MEPLQLCSRVNGKLNVNEANLQKVFEIENFSLEALVAIICITGEKGCGKTIYTNLLTQNLRNDSTKEWLDKFIKSNSGSKLTLPGFPLRNKANDTSNVSIWPESFYVTNHGVKFMVLVVHVEYSKNDPRAENVDSLEVFLSLLASKIVEIHWKKPEFRFLGIYRDLMKHDETLFGDIVCNNITYFLRSEMKPPELKQNIAVNNEADKSLRNLMTSKSARMALEDIKDVEVAFIPDKKHSFHFEQGLSNTMYNVIYDSINMVADEERLRPKTIFKKGTHLMARDLVDYIKACVTITNYIMGHHEETPIFKHPLHPDAANEQLCQKIDENGNETDDSIYTVSHDKVCKFTDDPVDSKSGPMSSNVSHLSNENIHEELGNVSRQEVEVCSFAPQHSQECLEFLDFVVEYANNLLATTMQSWNKDDLNFRCVDILGNCIQAAFINHPDRVKVFQENDINWLINTALNKLNKSNQDLIKIEEQLQIFHSQMNTATQEENGLYLLIELEKFKSEVASGNHLGDFSKKFILNIGNTCVANYMTRHRSTDIFIWVLDNVRVFYANEMQRYLGFGPYSMDGITNLHSTLLFHIVSTMLDLLGMYMKRDLSEWRCLLDRILLPKIKPDLMRFKKANMSLLLKLQKKLSSAISKAKVKYDEKICDEIMKRSPFNVLQRVHDAVKGEAVQYLEDIIKQLVRPNEPAKIHVVTLKSLIDIDWRLQSKSYAH